MHRRTLLLAAFAMPFVSTRGFAAPVAIEVYKSATCGCCGAWIAHLQASGFAPSARNLEQNALYDLKARVGLTPDLASCHTALVDGYFIEGHVPAPDIARLLSEKPKALGLTVPGMPIGSPGMEMGDEREPFETLIVYADGRTEVFASHNQA